MRKKDIIKLNEELFCRAEGYKAETEKIKKELEALKKRVEELSLENSNLKKADTAPSPIKALEEKVLNHAAISDDTQYGAEIIGKIVVNATISCNKLTSSGESSQVKELVNLILGRTEIAKGEILNIVSSKLSLGDKKIAIDSEMAACEDYFQSVMAQNYQYLLFF